MKKNRIWELDFLRGFAIVLVVFDHAFYDFGYVFNEWTFCGVPFLEKLCAFSQAYVVGDIRSLWRPAFLFLFFCVSGICTALSRNNFLRGVRLWAVAAATSLVTFLVDYSFGAGGSFVLFGVLHCLAVTTLLFSAVEAAAEGVCRLVKKKTGKENDRVKRVALTAVHLAIVAAGLALHFKFNPTVSDVSANGAVSHAVDGKTFGMFFFTAEWWTGDYFPLFPYLSFFFFGAVLGKWLYPRKRSLLPLLEGKWYAPVAFVGRHSLVTYLGGQVLSVVIGVLLSLTFLGEPVLW